MLFRQACVALRHTKRCERSIFRQYSSNANETSALILGLRVAKEEKSDGKSTKVESVKPVEGTESFNFYNDKWNNSLKDLISIGNPIKAGQAKTFYGKNDEFSAVTVVGIGESDQKRDYLEQIDGVKENMRKAISAGVKSYKDSGIKSLLIDASISPLAAAEGAFLSSWCYKEKDRNKFPPTIQPLNKQDETEWKTGRIMAESQNFARHLMESPANHMTPSIFAECVHNAFDEVKEELDGNVEITVRDKEWIESERMGAFLSVSRGSDESPKFVEIHYKSNDHIEGEPLILVGKGVTFDSGGVSIKPSQGMDEMRADMGGAATVASALLGAARLNTSGHFIGLIPLCENMVNGKATKPGDVVTARNGTTIQVDNTDAEGRLLLADALLYAQDFKPAAVVNVATLTGAMMVALGSATCGAFVNDESIWNQLQQAGWSSGDRVWRMPLFQHYSHQVAPSHLADINNVGSGGRGGGACTAAAFLHHFIEEGVKWGHLDIAGVMSSNGTDTSYLGKGMAGRPTRTLIQFMRDFKLEN